MCPIPVVVVLYIRTIPVVVFPRILLLNRYDPNQPECIWGDVCMYEHDVTADDAGDSISQKQLNDVNVNRTITIGLSLSPMILLVAVCGSAFLDQS